MSFSNQFILYGIETFANGNKYSTIILNSPSIARKSECNDGGKII